MTKDEALKLALEALESLYNDSELMVTHRQHKGMKNAITAIREALAQPDVDRRSTESKETFDQQEPVAYLDEGLGAFYWAKDYKKHVGFKPLYTTPPHRKPLEGVIDVRPIGYHSLQLIFRSQTDIAEFKTAHGIKE